MFFIHLHKSLQFEQEFEVIFYCFICLSLEINPMIESSGNGH